MSPTLDQIGHPERIVRIADDTLARRVQRQLLAAEDIPARLCPVGTEVRCGAHKDLLRIRAGAERRQLLRLRLRQRIELRWEFRGIEQLHTVLRIDIETARTADNI